MKKLFLSVAFALALAACGDLPQEDGQPTTVNNTTVNNTTIYTYPLDAGTSITIVNNYYGAIDGGSADAGTVSVTPDAVPAVDTVPAVSFDAQAPDTTPAVEPLVIMSVEVSKFDSIGNPAEDVRTFRIQFNAPAVNIWLSIYETVSGANFLWTPVMADGTATQAVSVSPGNWPAKLKPDTSYGWKVTANSPDGKQTVSMSGVFVTAPCFPGQARHCYSGAPGTEGVGRCRGGNQTCIQTDKGPQWNKDCVDQVLPYTYGDRCGDGVDEDCDGLVDNSLKMSVPAGQDSTWLPEGGDGEVLRFDVDSVNASDTRFNWFNVIVERSGLFVGYYHLWTMNIAGEWVDISNDVRFYDANGGGYREGMLDLGKNLCTDSGTSFVLGVEWKDSNGMLMGRGYKYHFMLVANVSPEVYGQGGMVRHYNPRSESSCAATEGKTITVP